MTSTEPCKLIHYENFYPRKDSLNHSDNGRQHHLPGAKKNHDLTDPIYTPRADPNFDGQLRAHENIACHNFLKIKRGLRFEKYPGWFDWWSDRQAQQFHWQ